MNEEILLVVDALVRQYGPYGAVVVAVLLVVRTALTLLLGVASRLWQPKPLPEEVRGLVAAIEQADGDAHGRLYRGHLFVEQNDQQVRLYLKSGDRFEEITANFSARELRHLKQAAQKRQQQLQALERAALRALAWEAVQQRGNNGSPDRKS